MLQGVKSYLGRCFAMKDLGEATYILGIKIYRDRSRRLIGLCQSAYIKKILKRYHMENSKRGSISMQEKLRLSKSQGASTPAELKRMQNVPYGVRCTRPDVAFAQNITSRFQQNPGDLHWNTVKNILKYLRNTKEMFLVYRVDWKSAKQIIFATSSVKAEYIAAYDASKEAVWVRKFIFGLGVVPTIEEPINMYCDNTGAIGYCPISSFPIREVIEYGDIKLEKVHTYDNLADPFTKALAFPKHSEHTKNIGMLPARRMKGKEQLIDEAVDINGRNNAFTEVRRRPNLPKYNGGPSTSYVQNHQKRVISKYVVKNKEILVKETRNNVEDVKNMEKKKNNAGSQNLKNNDTPPSLEKIWRINTEDVNELKKSANKYAILVTEEEGQENICCDDRIKVDWYVLRKQRPKEEETVNWTYDMKKYLECRWEALNRKDDESDEENEVLEVNDPAIENLIAEEIQGSINNELKQKDAVNMLRGEKLQFCAFIETHLKTKSIKKFFYNIIYASNNGIERRSLWKDLEGHKYFVGQQPWVLIGDFNVTLNVEEHSAGMSHRNIDMQEFHDVVNKLEIKDICTTHGIFLPYGISDHSSAVLIIQKGYLRKNNAFRFSNFTAGKKEFIDTVKNVWKHDVHGCYMYRLIKKMKTLKKPLKALSWSHGNVYDRVRALKDELNSKQKDADENPFDLKIKTIAAQTLNEYIEASKDELTRRNKSRVESIKDEYGKVYEGRNVAEQFVLHFKNFLGEFMPVTNIEEDLFINKINDEDDVKMTKEVTNDEIKSAIFYSDSNKAFGPDGFSSEFFKKAWEVIGNDVCLAVKELFRSGKILGEINATLIALIPKINTPSKVSDFRPIACCNVIYKCISKILTNRIKNGLSKIVNINQSAFIPGRHIQNNILIAQELLRGSNRKNGRKRCAMQIDIQKAYDTVNWSFWKGGRGLKQGDPIPPYLFTLVIEVFNLIMSKKIKEYNEYKFHFGCKELKLSHMCFADDLLVLCKGNKGSLEVIKKTLDEFSQVSGLNPNLGKSIIFFGSIKESDKHELLKILPFKCGKLPTYWASAYLLSNYVRKDLDKLFKRLLWNSGNSAQGKARVTWKMVCRPKDQGGLGIKPLKQWNEVLLIRDAIKEHVWHSIGNGKKTSMFYDKWCLNGPLSKFISKRNLYDARICDNVMVDDMLIDNNWKWPIDWLMKFPKVKLSTKQAWITMREDWPRVQWYHVVWYSQLIPKHAFILWLAIQNKLLTQDIMEKWQDISDMKCSLCKKCADSHEHLFFKCEFALQVWKEVMKKSTKLGGRVVLKDIVKVISDERSNNRIGVVINKLIVAATVYNVWQERNQRIFRKEYRTAEDICKTVYEQVKSKLMTLKVKKSVNVIKEASKWDLQWNNMSLIASMVVFLYLGVSLVDTTIVKGMAWGTVFWVDLGSITTLSQEDQTCYGIVVHVAVVFKGVGMSSSLLFSFALFKTFIKGCSRRKWTKESETGSYGKGEFWNDELLRSWLNGLLCCKSSISLPGLTRSRSWLMLKKVKFERRLKGSGNVDLSLI
ncbi:RNA-directed DNA polymerase, eukaryota, reverse transcriptase zinc-binding domain protein [Tanacetum coccineum]